MKVLVAYASKHGSTEEVAGRIGKALRQEGLDTVVLPVGSIQSLDAYGAIVVGSSVYFEAWSREAADWVRRHREELNRIPVWLFSMGPVGDKELPVAREVAEFDAMIKPRDHRVFSGVIDRTKLNFAERLMVKGVGAPEGDFRDWGAIDAWAIAIAEALSNPVLK